MECPQKNGEGDELIVAYVAGTLDLETEAAMERHLAECASCRETAVQQRAVWSALDELEALPVSTNFDANLYERIAQDAQIPWWRRFIGGNWSWRPAFPVAAACAILIVAFLVKDTPRTVAPQSPAQPKLEIEQVESALDDMDLLRQVGVETGLEITTPREKI